MKKLIILLILLTTIMSCELFDGEEWARYRERIEERGVKCYRRHNGTIYCEDKYGNPV